MYIQSFFTAQTESSNIYGIDGINKATEKVHYTRTGISNNDFAHTHKYKGLLEEATVINEGDMLVNAENDKFLVTSLRKTAFSNQANMLKCDSTCSIYSLTNKYVKTQIVGKKMTPLKENIPCVQKDTNGKINFFDASLLETTIKVVYIQTVDGVKITDRLVVDNKAYQIDSIDAASIKGLTVLQLSRDKRDFE